MAVTKSIHKQLLESIRQRNAVIVAGAGVTMSATDDPSCSWAGLMKDGIENAVDIDRDLAGLWQAEQEALLASSEVGDWIELAENITAQLRRHAGDRYARWLEETAGSYADRILAPSLPEILGRFPLPILTTNYDDVLERVTGRGIATFKDLDRFQSELNQPGETIVHLHGHWSEPNDVVFGYTSYSQAIGHDASQSVIRALASIKQMILVGFGSGIADPNFTALGTWLSSKLRDNRNAPIVLTTDSKFKQLERRGRQLGFVAVSVGSDHQDIDVYLSDLIKEADLGPQEPTAYTWDLLQSKITRLVRRVSREFAPEVIVTMSGPGSTVAALCLRQFDTDPPLLTAVTFPKTPILSAAGASFEAVADAADWIHLETTRWHMYLPNALRHFPPNTRALILDDRVVGGNAQKRAADLLRDLGFEVKTAALVVHPDVEASVDYSEERTEHDFTFPWGGKYGRNDPPVRKSV